MNQPQVSSIYMHAPCSSNLLIAAFMLCVSHNYLWGMATYAHLHMSQLAECEVTNERQL